MKFMLHAASMVAIAAQTMTAMAADAPGTPILIPPPGQEVAAATFDRQGFTRQYEQAGKPAIAIFWNRRVSDALSQWQAYSRQVVDRRLSGRAAPGDDTDANDNENYDCSFASSSTEAGDCSYTESRFSEDNIGTGAGRNTTKFATPRDEFEFGAAFTQSLLASGVIVVDRELVMRLTQGQNRQQSLAPAITDYYEIELQALEGYAAYVAEILLADTAVPGDDLSFMVSIKEVSSGRVVGMFSVEASSQNPEAANMSWETGPTGYKRVLDITQAEGKVAEIGQRVGEQTMEALVAYWALAR